MLISLNKKLTKYFKKISHEKEWSLSIKVSSQNIIAVTEVIKNLHPYDIPQIITQEIQSNKEYEDWVNSI